MAALDEQSNYITDFRQTVQKELNDAGELTDEQKARLKAAMQERYAGYALEFLIDLNADGMVKEFVA